MLNGLYALIQGIICRDFYWDILSTGTSFHKSSYKLLLDLGLLPRFLQRTQTSQVVYNVFGLSKVDFLQRVSHLQLHIFHHTTNVCNMCRWVIHREVLLGLDNSDQGSS